MALGAAFLVGQLRANWCVCLVVRRVARQLVHEMFDRQVSDERSNAQEPPIADLQIVKHDLAL